MRPSGLVGPESVCDGGSDVSVGPLYPLGSFRADGEVAKWPITASLERVYLIFPQRLQSTCFEKGQWKNEKAQKNNFPGKLFSQLPQARASHHS